MNKVLIVSVVLLVCFVMTNHIQASETKTTQKVDIDSLFKDDIGMMMDSNSVSYTQQIFRRAEFDFKLWGVPTDEDYYKNVTELIEARGFPWEQHYVTTSDGFILSLQRIPHGREQKKHKKNNSFREQQKPVVFLQHGLLDASETWVQNYEHQSLAFILADAGCDVWLGNVRGNIYSDKNEKWKPSDKEFWTWSFDEMASIDLPTMIDYVLAQTNRKQLDAYVGHSQGTIIAFACFSSRSCGNDLSSRVKQFIALAPVAYVGHVQSGLLSTMAKLHADEWLIRLGFHNFLPSSKILQKWVPEMCQQTIIGRPFCAEIYCLFAGCDSLRDNVNQTRLATYFSHLPAGTSVVNVAHWAQMVRKNKFEMLDMGSPQKNRKRYGRDTPPKYDLSQLNVDLFIYYGGKDILGTVTDLDYWLPFIPKDRIKHIKLLPNYGHMDVVWGIHANRDIYSEIVTFITKGNNTQQF